MNMNTARWFRTESLDSKCELVVINNFETTERMKISMLLASVPNWSVYTVINVLPTITMETSAIWTHRTVLFIIGQKKLLKISSASRIHSAGEQKALSLSLHRGEIKSGLLRRRKSRTTRSSICRKVSCITRYCRINTKGRSNKSVRWITKFNENKRGTLYHRIDEKSTSSDTSRAYNGNKRRQYRKEDVQSSAYRYAQTIEKPVILIENGASGHFVNDASPSMPDDEI